ncbi:cation transporter [Williamwhitmania taraxaci]|uniref:Copper chaperone n=1 Tax=Williamwhitmania taraxaci TaxID=1640674 RepID=A0A1G6QRE0_9BACT|nr:cation transporter [Williamwhitmania taraxaci]SDC94920.1 copper chaperone [Williamwhitmania taraxaci]
MKTLQFTTNINCGGCVAKVKSLLDTANGIAKWSIDTAKPDKLLVVETETLTEEEIILMIASKGFKAERL